MIMSLGVHANTSVSNTASDLSIQITKNELAQKERYAKLTTATARDINKVRAGIVAYYMANMGWPANLSDIESDGFYAGSFKTPYGTINGEPNGSNYDLYVSMADNSDQGKRIASLVAAKSGGTANNEKVSLSVGVPTAASLVSGMLSRKYDPSNPDANKMETSIDMNGNNINDINTLNAKSLAADNATIDTALSVTGDTTLNNLTATGITSLATLTVNEDANFKKNVTVDGTTSAKDISVTNQIETDTLNSDSLTVTGLSTFKGGATVNGPLTVTGNTTFNDNLNMKDDTTLTASNIKSKNLQVLGVANIQDAIIGTLSVNENVSVEGVIKQKENLVVDDTGRLYEQGQLVSTKYASLEGDNVFSGNQTFKNNVNFNQLSINQGLNTNQLSIKKNGAWVDVSSELTRYMQDVNSHRQEINQLSSDYGSLVGKINQANSRITSATNTVNSFNNRITNAERTANSANSTAGSALWYGQDARTRSQDNERSINGINTRLASLESFERNCRNKHYVCN